MDKREHTAYLKEFVAYSKEVTSTKESTKKFLVRMEINFLKDNPPHNSKQNVEEPSVIRKPNCIKGYFIPLDLDSKYARP